MPRCNTAITRRSGEGGQISGYGCASGRIITQHGSRLKPGCYSTQKEDSEDDIATPSKKAMIYQAGVNAVVLHRDQGGGVMLILYL